ncbi:MAG: hypothetical protein Q9225_002638 [Loekoesia sp. 1 TL-2023]
MLRCVQSISSYQALHICRLLWIPRTAHFHERYLSTNSAISKGLRKSRRGRSNLDPPARLGGITRRAEPRKEADDFWHRIPNSKQLRKANEGSLTRSQHGRSFDRRGRTQGIGSRLSSSSRTRNRSEKLGEKAAPLNRAERRALAFGHKENPPEGYKALSNTSTKQQYSSQDVPASNQTGSPGHQSSRRQTNNQTEFAIEKGLDRSEERISAPSDERPRRKSNVPLAIPHTTPASEFLYGHSVITSALKASRRKLYKLYLYNGDTAEVRGQDRQVRKLALAANVEVTRVGSNWLKLMDKMSGGRPHNGYILEASPLPRLPVTALQSVPNPQLTFRVSLNHQSKEEEAINGSDPIVRYGTGYRRYPFLLLLDGIRDPGNMGAIFRSAHFLGADGIIICTRNSAPLTPVTLKAAAGAAESLPIFLVDQPVSFIDNCRRNGWKCYAAVSPSSLDSERAIGRPFYFTSTMGNPTQKHPCILILGSEGEGLRWSIQKKADFLLGIEAQRTGDGDLDSLNVSVAAALLCHAFLKKPTTDEDVSYKHQERLVAAPADSSREGDSSLGLATGEPGSHDEAAVNQRLF